MTVDIAIDREKRPQKEDTQRREMKNEMSTARFTYSRNKMPDGDDKWSVVYAS